MDESSIPEPSVFDEAEFLPPHLQPEAEVGPPPPDFLDLDALDLPVFPVVIAGETYQMVGKHDLSMAGREDLRLTLLKISDLTEKAAGGRKTELTESERKLWLHLEQRICQIALPDCPWEVITRLTAAQRNTLTDYFFEKADVMGIVRSFVTTLQQQMVRQSAGGKLSQIGSMPSPPPDLLANGRSPSTTGNVS